MHAGTKIDVKNKAIGIIAGGGKIPQILAQYLEGLGARVFVVRLQPFCDAALLEDFAGIDAKLDEAGKIFAALRREKISDIVLIGAVTRPNLWRLRPDFTTLKILPKLLWALLCKGDDVLLRAVHKVFGQAGFKLHGVHDFVGGLLASKGVMGQHDAGPIGKEDIEFGWGAALAHGAADKGQAIVVQRGMILDVEGRDGTDALIARVAKIKIPGGAQPILVKTVKPGQSWRIDLPTVGVDTIQNCFEAGFAGIAVEAGGVLMVERERMIALADEYGMFVIGR